MQKLYPGHPANHIREDRSVQPTMIIVELVHFISCCFNENFIQFDYAYLIEYIKKFLMRKSARFINKLLKSFSNSNLIRKIKFYSIKISFKKTYRLHFQEKEDTT